MSDPEVILSGVRFGESPRWHQGALWFSEMLEQRVVRLRPEGGVEEIVRLPNDRPSGLGWDAEGRLLIVSMFERKVVRREADGALTDIDLDAYGAGIMNDMVVDRHGRAYVGNLGYDPQRGEPPTGGPLVMIDVDGSTSEGANGLRGANGLMVSDDGSRLIVAELEASRFTALDIDQDTGTLSNPRLWADVAPLRPDGCCLDAEGYVWFGSPPDHVFSRVAPGGEIVAQIPTTGRRSIACMLGGESGTRLYMCTASSGGADWFNGTVRDGWIEAVEVDAPRAGMP